MIKTLNDLLSLIALLIVTFLCLRIFVGSLIKKDNELSTDTMLTRKEYLKDYINNEED